jgi:hypothetical protein
LTAWHGIWPARLEEEKQVAASGGTLYDHKFVYDEVGNLLQKLDLTTSPPTVLTELTYNAADQITSDGFDYDDRGNMLTEARPKSGAESITTRPGVSRRPETPQPAGRREPWSTTASWSTTRWR